MAKPLSCRIRPSPIQEWREICFSGSVVTKGGLLFTGRADGRLTALDKATGEKLWELGGGPNLLAFPADYIATTAASGKGTAMPAFRAV